MKHRTPHCLPVKCDLRSTPKLLSAHLGLRLWPVAKEFLTVCGLASVKAIAEHTPHYIERLFFDAEHAALFGNACRYLAERRKTYRLVSADELKRLTSTLHHQGVAAVIQALPPQNLPELSLERGTLCLNDVLNPHNVGAILRSAAFFGITDLVVSARSFAAAMTAAAWRVAEGGMTHCRLFSYSSEKEFFRWVHAKDYTAVAAIKPGGKAIAGLKNLLSMGKGAPLIICLGNEEEGLSKNFIKNCHVAFTIPGSGKIESLNVSVTAALCLEKLVQA